MSEYDPMKYWEDRAKRPSYVKYTQIRKTEEEVISKVIQKYGIKSIFEIGVGTGRFFPLYHKYNLEVTGCDVASKFIEIANSSGYNYKIIQYTGTKIPILNNHADLTISSEVLLHVPEKDVEEVFGEHIRISKKYILIIVSHNADEKKLPFTNQTDFDHNYEDLIKKYKLKILNCGYIDKTLYHFLLEKQIGGR